MHSNHDALITLTYLIILAWLYSGCARHANDTPATSRLRVLIIDGQNNHDWRTTTPLMKSILEESGRFKVDVATTAPEGQSLDGFQPKFEDYDAVVSNYNGAAWPPETQRAFTNYVANGGGFICVHAADNAFPEWEEYNRMIALGGWGGRDERSGPYVYVDDDEQLQRDLSPGSGGHHGAQHEFQVVIRDPQHPITRGMPRAWMHSQDELYEQLRGPALEMQILATAFASPKFGGSGRHEPLVMTISFDQGRIFHLALGHADYSMECVGFATLLNRGCEWAATGEVTLTIPDDFPTSDETSSRG